MRLDRVLILYFVIIEFKHTSATNKTLKIPVLIVNYPKTGQTCAATMNIIVEIANSRPDILGGYNIELEIHSEKPAGANVNEELIKYMNKFVNGTIENLFPSPIIAGPYSADFAAVLIKSLHLTSFSQYTDGPLMVGNPHYDHVFRTRIPANNYMIPLVALAKQNKWKQIAVMATSIYPGTVSFVKHMYKFANSHGVTPIYFDIGPSFTHEMVTRMKNSDARIIFMISGIADECINFLCYAHRAGIRAPKYTFVSAFWCMKTVMEEPPFSWCTREMLEQQLMNTFYGGAFPTGLEHYNSPFLNSSELDSELEKLAKSDPAITGKNWRSRHTCHDVLSAAILTLNKTEQVLNDIYNKSLSDFVNEPELVGRTAFENAKLLDFVGLRMGRMKYSGRGELDDEPLWMVQYKSIQNDSSFEFSPIFVMTPLNNDDPTLTFNLSNYRIIQISKNVRWMTRSGKPLKDLSSVIQLEKEMPMEVVAAVLVVSMANIIFQTIVCFRWFVNIRKHSNLYFENQSNLLIACGCILLNLSSIVHICGLRFFPTTFCQWKPLLPTVAISLIHFPLFLRSFTMTSFLNLFNDVLKRKNKRSWITDNKQLVKVRFAAISVLTLFSLLLVTLWIFVDPLKIYLSKTNPEFNEAKDTYFLTSRQICTNDNEPYWLMSLVLKQVVLNLLALCFVYRNRTTPRPIKYSFEFQTLQLATVNGATLTIAAILILVITHGKFLLQNAIFSLIIVLHSFSMFSIIFFPVWSMKWPSNDKKWEQKLVTKGHNFD